ncbi:MAG: type I restriction-modification system subunit M [Akkermansia sp.]|nr:type I restriction-modification system subunit M [Akkermansia sp.]
MDDSIKILEAKLWDTADSLRAGSNLTSAQYCMPVLGLIFLRYAFSRFKMVEAEVLRNRVKRQGQVRPVEAADFAAKSAIFLPEAARYDYLVSLPGNIASAGLRDESGYPINSLGEAVNHAMRLVEGQSRILTGVLPKGYTMFDDVLLGELLRNFNNSALDDVGGDVIGRIYEYFLNKFAQTAAQDDGVFFTPKSLVKMIVNVLEPRPQSILIDPACGSGGMFVQTGDFINHAGMSVNKTMTFYGQEKVDYNAQLCLMNMAVHGLEAKIASGSAANSFYTDAFNLAGKCDYVMANPPFNVDKVNADEAAAAGRLPFGLPSYNAKTKAVGNGNYLWISYFYAYLNERGRAGFVMAASATDSNPDRPIRKQLVETGHVDVMVSVGNNFFYTKSLPCTLWFFDKGKQPALQDEVLFIDARAYFTYVSKTLNTWSEWQLRNLNAIVWLYRGESQKYTALLQEYREALQADALRSSLRLAPHASFAEAAEALERHLAAQKEQAKAAAETAPRAQKKAVEQEWKAALEHTAEALATAREALWLTDKFGDGVYRDVPGLCRRASRAEIAEKNYSLTPGAYVGVAPQEDDGIDFATRMREIHDELNRLQQESDRLMQEINANREKLGI